MFFQIFKLFFGPFVNLETFEVFVPSRVHLKIYLDIVGRGDGAMDIKLHVRPQILYGVKLPTPLPPSKHLKYILKVSVYL